MQVLVCSVRYGDQTIIDIDSFNRADKRLDPFQQLAQGIDDCIEFEIARGYLRQHRREQKIIFPAD